MASIITNRHVKNVIYATAVLFSLLGIGVLIPEIHIPVAGHPLLSSILAWTSRWWMFAGNVMVATFNFAGRRELTRRTFNVYIVGSVLVLTFLIVMIGSHVTTTKTLV